MNLRRFTLFLLLSWFAGLAHANLMINPTRIVLDKNQRAAQVDLINNGNETMTYRLSVVNRRMSETGEFQVVSAAAPGELFADHMIQFSPRQVVLAPGTSQLVRVLVRKPADLADGEYRSHLVIERIADSATSAAADAAANGEVGIKLTALVGVSIPVIVRHGDTTAEAKLSGIAVVPATDNAPAMVSFNLERSGSRSVYGDVQVLFTPAGGSEEIIARAGGVAVYVPNTLRRAKLPLPKGTVTLAKGKLVVRYQERADDGGKRLAEATLDLP